MALKSVHLKQLDQVNDSWALHATDIYESDRAYHGESKPYKQYDTSVKVLRENKRPMVEIQTHKILICVLIGFNRDRLISVKWEKTLK